MRNRDMLTDAFISLGMCIVFILQNKTTQKGLELHLNVEKKLDPVC